MKNGFTLAEVLITLGIVGVVAAMTLPTIITDYRDKAASAKMKKLYSLLSSAYMYAYNEYGDPTQWGFGNVSNNASTADYQNSKLMYEYFGKNLKIYKDCNKGSGCFASGYYKFTNKSNWDMLNTSTHRYKVITNDGVSMAFHWYSGSCSSVEGSLKICGMIFVDIDGPNSGQSMFGYDLFRFFLTKDGIIPDGAPKHVGGNKAFSQTECPTKGPQCAYWLIEYGNRDYLRCSGLAWSGKTKCK